MTTVVNPRGLRRNLQRRLNKPEHTMVKGHNESTPINSDTQIRTTPLLTGVEAIKVPNEAIRMTLRTRTSHSIIQIYYMYACQIDQATNKRPTNISMQYR